MRVPSVPLLSLPLLPVLSCWSLAAAAQAPAAPQTMEHCAAIGAATDRLACYDKAMGRAPAQAAPPAY
jgi:hypothetical protein